MSFCCAPFCYWYVSLSEGPGCPPNNVLQCFTDVSCCTCSYCFCGENSHERRECCSNLFAKIDNIVDSVLCCFCNYSKQRQDHELALQKEKNKHELELLKFKPVIMVR